MTDFTNYKSGPGGLFPANASNSQWNRLEPLITPEQLRNRQLFGIPLVSGMKDPVTGKYQIMTNDLLKDIIDRAVAQCEIETGIDIFPNVIDEKQAFDQAEYSQYGYFRTRRRPISGVNLLTVCPTTNEDIFTVPIEWIETGYLPYGQINILPLTAALGQGGFVPAMSAGGAVFLAILGTRPWMPSFWKIQYISGFLDGQLPKIINELVGVQSAIIALSSLAATKAISTSHSLGIDGLSQSVSGPGPQMYVTRIQELELEKKSIIGKVKNLFGLKLFSGNL
jgi:hypothetical protein